MIPVLFYAEVNLKIIPILSANSLTSASVTFSFSNKPHLFRAIPNPTFLYHKQE